MKFKKMLSCFVAFVLICCNLVLSTCSAKLPSSYPVFKFDLELDNNVAPYPWCYILMYNQSSNDYELYIIFNDYEFYNETSLSCYYSSSSSSFLIDRKKLTNLSAVKIYEVLFKTKDKSSIPPVWSGCEIYSQNINTIPFRFSYDDDYPCTNSKHYEIVASNRDIIFNQSNGVSVSGGNLVTFVKGDENYLNSFFADGFKPVYPSFEYQPVTQPGTSESSGGSGGSGTSEEQVKTSKNILENVKNMFVSIVNLPNKIFTAFSDILTSIAETISNLCSSTIDFFTNFFSRIVDALKNLFVTLFVPDDDGILSEIKDIITTKFGFFSQFVSFGETLINSNFGNEEPKSFSFTLYGNTWNLIDWSVVAPYRSTIRTITIIVNYYWFIQKTIKRIPGVIGGFSSD